MPGRDVILDIVTQDDEWLDWSADALERSAGSGRLVINPVIYAEVSIGFSTIEELEDAVPPEYFSGRPCRGKRHFSPATPSYATAGAAALEFIRCRTFTLALMPCSLDTRC
jgi:hypothetical protein